jgi:hypothetical protein
MSVADEPTEETDDLDGHVILYPAGGAFNKLRSRQTYLECLIDANWLSYAMSSTQGKRDYIRVNILDRITESGRVLKVFRGKHPENGSLASPSDDEAMERISQKLRDMKKRKALQRNRKQTKAAGNAKWCQDADSSDVGRSFRHNDLFLLERSLNFLPPACRNCGDY